MDEYQAERTHPTVGASPSRSTQPPKALDVQNVDPGTLYNNKILQEQLQVLRDENDSLQLLLMAPEKRISESCLRMFEAVRELESKLPRQELASDTTANRAAYSIIKAEREVQKTSLFIDQFKQEALERAKVAEGKYAGLMLEYGDIEAQFKDALDTADRATKQLLAEKERTRQLEAEGVELETAAAELTTEIEALKLERGDLRDERAALQMEMKGAGVEHEARAAGWAVERDGLVEDARDARADAEEETVRADGAELDLTSARNDLAKAREEADEVRQTLTDERVARDEQVARLTEELRDSGASLTQALEAVHDAGLDMDRQASEWEAMKEGMGAEIREAQTRAQTAEEEAERVGAELRDELRAVQMAAEQAVDGARTELIDAMSVEREAWVEREAGLARELRMAREEVAGLQADVTMKEGVGTPHPAAGEWAEEKARLTSELDALRGEVARSSDAEDRLRQQTQGVDALAEQLATATADAARSELVAEQMRADLQTAAEAGAELATEVEQLTERLQAQVDADLTDARPNLGEEITALRTELETVQTALKEAIIATEAEKTDKGRLADEMDRVRAEMVADAEARRAEREALQADIAALEEDARVRSIAAQSMARDVEEREEAIDRLRREVEAAEEQGAARHGETSARVAQLERDNDELRAVHKEMKRTVADMRSAAEETRKELADARGALLAINTLEKVTSTGVDEARYIDHMTAVYRAVDAAGGGTHMILVDEASANLAKLEEERRTRRVEDRRHREEVEAMKGAHETRVAELDGMLGDMKGAMETLEQRVSDTSSELEAAKQAISVQEEALVASAAEVADLTEKLADHEANPVDPAATEELESRARDAEAELTRRAEDLASATDHIARLERDVAQLDETVAGLVEDAHVRDRELHAATNDNYELDAANAGNLSRVRELETYLDEVATAKEQVERDVAGLRATVRDLTADLRAARATPAPERSAWGDAVAVAWTVAGLLFVVYLCVLGLGVSMKR